MGARERNGGPFTAHSFLSIAGSPTISAKRLGGRQGFLPPLLLRQIIEDYRSMIEHHGEKLIEFRVAL